MDMSPANMPRIGLVGGRRADRRSFDAQIQFRKGNKRATVILRDISQFGARVAGVYLVQPDDRFFLTLPGPIPALDSWEKMLPTAQRMAELLDGVVLDESRNALGRQRIAHIRDDLRAWDRKREKAATAKW